MNKEYYEFMFKMRSSGLIHNTPDYLARQAAIAYFSWNTQYSLTADSDGNLTARQNENGEIGMLSEDFRKNMRNAIISTASILPVIADAEKIDFEAACILNDYYISRADEIRTAAQFNEEMKHLFADFKELMEASQHRSYGVIVDRAVDYINQNLYSRLRLSQIAEYTGYSPAYLSDLFYEKTGKHLQEYILDRKTDEVKKLLLFSDRSCTEIAGALGYASLSHLSASFKARTGQTLREFRSDGRPSYQHEDPDQYSQ